LFCLQRKHLSLWVILNTCFLRRGVVSTSPNPQAGGPPLVGCPRLLIQFIHSYRPYRRPFLHPQPEDAPCPSTYKKNLERFSTYVFTCSFLPCLSWLLQLVSSNFTTNTDDVKIKFHTYFSLWLSCSHHVSLFLYSSTTTTCVQQCYNVWTNMGYYPRSRLTNIQLP